MDHDRLQPSPAAQIFLLLRQNEIQLTGSMADLPLVNRLAESQSPYVSAPPAAGCAQLTSQVRAHRENPVAWQMWTPETLALAKKLDRLIFLSIGYSACHCTTAYNP
jgi:uncharacterized protein YyaL (SSP411 family)